MLSQISLVTMVTASQPGGNVMGKKNVLTGQMNQKQRAVSSSKWCFSDLFLLSKHGETEAVIPSTCRMICQFMLVLRHRRFRSFKSHSLQTFKCTHFPDWYRQYCLVWICVCKGAVNILSCLSGSWSAAVEKCHAHLGSGFLETQIWCFAW